MVPKISVIMPLYNSSECLRESIESVQKQSLSDWELLIIHEYGSDREGKEIVEAYGRTDDRIRLIQNTERLGLAESLNRGIRLAAGEYIARMDADDLSHPQRFQLEAAYLDRHPDTIVCGSWQRHFGEGVEMFHKPPAEPMQCKANLLFFCDLCHSTVMMRRKPIIENGLFYNSTFYAEDFELWTRVLDFGEIANIPKVLGGYRLRTDSKTAASKAALQEESGRIAAKTLEKNLGLVLSPAERGVLCSWENPILKIPGKSARKKGFCELEGLLRRIYKENLKVQYYDNACLLRAIRAKWYWARYCHPFNEMQDVASIDEIFLRHMELRPVQRFCQFWRNTPGVAGKIKKIRRKLSSAVQKKEE